MTFYFDLVVVIQEGNWWNFAYGSALLFICLVVCLIGAGMFAKTSFIIFLVVLAAVTASFVSFLIVDGKGDLPPGAENTLRQENTTYNYTGWNSATFHRNLWVCEFSF